MKNKMKLQLNRKRQVVFYITLVAVLVSIGGYWYYDREKEQIRNSKEGKLTAIAKLKTKQIKDWYMDELNDVSLIANNRFLIETVNNFIHTASDADKVRVNDFLKQIKSEHNLKDIYIFNPRGVHFTSGHNQQIELSDAELKAMDEALLKRKSIATNLFHAIYNGNKKIFISFISTIEINEGNQAFTIICRINPNYSLYPLVESWPVPSQTAESFIFSVNDDSIMYLNNLRHKPNTALNLKIPVSQTTLPAAKAAAGQTGAVVGKDYRDVDVVAYVGRIEGTPWYFVSKIDSSELYAELPLVMIRIAGFVLFSILLTGFVVWVIYSLQKRQLLVESEARYRLTLDSMIEGCQLIGFDYKYLLLNKTALEQAQLPKEKLLGKTMMECYPGIENSEMFRVLKRCMEERVTEILDNEFTHQNGSKGYYQLKFEPVPEGVFILSDDITKKNLAEETSRESVEKFENAFEYSAIGMAIISLEGKWLKVNSNVCKIVGYSEEELFQKTWQEITHPDDLHTDLSYVEKMIAGIIENYDMEKRYFNKNGNIVWVHLFVSLIKDKNGLPLKFISQLADITDRKQNESWKQRQKEILESIVKGESLHAILEKIVEEVEEKDPTSTCSILLLDEEGKHLNNGAAPNLPDFYNQAIEGLEIGEHVGSCGAAAYSKKQVIAEDLLTHPNWIPFRELVQKANLRSCWSLPILGAEGNVLGTFAIYHHIPKSPSDNETELLQSVVALASLAITRKRNEEKVRNLNAELEIKVEKRTKELAAMNAILNDEIEERRTIEESLQIAKADADKANLAKSEFLSRMSHELRTPMNSILGFAQLMEMGEISPAHKKGIAQILKSGKHLLDLINEVLDLSRIEAGKLTISIEPVSVCGIISETLDIVNPLADDRNISLKLINLSNENIFVKADNQKLKQVLLNLVNNAVKFNRDRGSVEIQCSKAYSDGGMEKKVRISVIDTGIGIKSEDLDKLFNPFQRIGAEVTEIEGTGLGLAVAKKLVEAMHGRIGVESKVGIGSTFWIEFPQSESQIEFHKKTNESKKAETANTIVDGTILYIEDNFSNIQLVEQILDIQRPSIHLITEMYGKNAVKLAADYKPTLILLDLDLPDIHGSEVLKRLQENQLTKSIPVVILSADATSHKIEKLMNSGAKYYLTKPLSVVEFLKVVDGLMVNG
jgi:PAS domain S-box-containing protein